MTTFRKTTLVGGAVFLLPLAIVLMLLGYALKLVSTVARPISEQLQLQQWDSMGGIGIVTALSARVLVLLSFLPHYQVLKSMAEGLARLEKATGIKPALISLEGGWQIGYLLEPLENGWLSVFLPQAPTPMSGNIMYFPANRVRPLDITMTEAMAIIKRIGVGSGEALRGADLTQPPGQ